MMKTKYKISLILLLFIGFGCSDEFLETEPRAAVLEDNYYQTEDQLFKALIAAYDPLQWTFTDGQWTSYVMLGEIRSDNANAGGDPSDSDQPGWQAIDDFVNTSLTEQSGSFWKRGWWGVYRANLVINNAAEGIENGELYKAEAKFLRAYYHFDLFRAFGPIPVLEHVVTQNEYTTLQRETVSSVFEFITNDLEEAIEVLPEEKYTGSFAGRVSKTTAQALLGKAYLYWADFTGDDPALFDKAADALEAVISSGQYELLDDYNDLFAFGVKNSEESVFEIQYTNLVPHDWGGVHFIDGNMITQLSGIRGICNDHPEYIAGWGFLLPTQSLYDHFLTDDTYRRNAAIITVQELSDDGCSVDQSQQNPADFEGYWQQKYANYKSYSNPNGGDINLQKDPNEPIIRYADVLLMYAEALIRGNGPEAEALTYINEVRERAAGPGDNTGSFKTAQEIMVEQGWSALDLIWYERRAELAGEGHRWFDLIRSGKAEAQLFGSRGDNFNSDQIFLPIPQKDIDISVGSLTEYPGTNLFQ